MIRRQVKIFPHPKKIVLIISMVREDPEFQNPGFASSLSNLCVRFHSLAILVCTEEIGNININRL